MRSEKNGRKQPEFATEPSDMAPRHSGKLIQASAFGIRENQ